MDIDKKVKDILDELFEAHDFRYEHLNVFNTVQVFVDGDWKHDHLYLRNVMEMNGFQFLGENNILSDGQDWYSSEHWYRYTGFDHEC